MKKLWVLGAGGHGKVVADVGRSAGFTLAGFIDADEARDGSTFYGVEVRSWTRFARERGAFAGAAFALAVGDNRRRAACFEQLRAAGAAMPVLVHASAVIAPTAKLGEGTVVMALVAVNPDAEVGQGVILNTGCVVEHDARIGDFAHLSPNSAIGGTVTIGARSHLGLGAVILPNLRVGADVRVGAGAVVVRDVPDGLTVAGVPARPLPPAQGR
jgi:sugar O-acyltransferase (sialic acid O-acetyltransferase NeuD family)